MSTASSAQTRQLPVAVGERPVVAVKGWAALGAALLAFQAFVLVRWISGPYFKSVDPGPTPLPGWMKAELTFWQIVLPIAGLVILYRLVIRPGGAGRRQGPEAAKGVP